MIKDKIMKKLLGDNVKRNKIYRVWEEFLFENGKKPKWVNVISTQVNYDLSNVQSVDIEGRIGYSKYNLEDLIKSLFYLMMNRKEVSAFSLNLEKNLDLNTSIKQISQMMSVVNFSFSYYKKIKKRR